MTGSFFKQIARYNQLLLCASHWGRATGKLRLTPSDFPSSRPARDETFIGPGLGCNQQAKRRGLMNGIRRWVAVLAICLGGASLAAPAATQSKVEKIRELLAITQTESLVQQVLPVVLKQMRGMVSRLRPDIPEAVWEETMAEAEVVFRESIDAFIETTIPIYERNLTEEEIDGMLAFYRTAVGQSVVKKLPRLTQESMLAGQQWGVAVNEEMRKRMVEKLAEEGYRI
jgi:hypothetical protein